MQLSVNSLIQSPLNYTGGKFKLLPQILPYFPNKIDTFVDLFCGGCNVGCNIKCNHIIFNDINLNLICLLETLKNNDKDVIFEFIFDIIRKYNLSQSNLYGYDFYNCNSEKGLGDYNRDNFNKLRNDFNKNKNPDYNYYLMLYVLIIYSFNNQIRFNSKGEFNLPVGKRDFNEKMQAKLNSFINKLHSISCHFEHIDFRDINFDNFNQEDFVYCDPPYLITCATYNEQGLWNEDLEKELLNTLDNFHHSNIRFALSNVLQSKGKENTILLNWLKNNPHYKCIDLDYSYSNSNYHTKDKVSKSREVLIINY